jgi:hypothetical protein
MDKIDGIPCRTSPKGSFGTGLVLVAIAMFVAAFWTLVVFAAVKAWT